MGQAFFYQDEKLRKLKGLFPLLRSETGITLTHILPTGK